MKFSLLAAIVCALFAAALAGCSKGNTQLTAGNVPVLTQDPAAVAADKAASARADTPASAPATIPQAVPPAK